MADRAQPARRGDLRTRRDMIGHPLRFASFALALVVTTPGCLDTRTGHPDEIGTRNVQEFSRTDSAAPAEWQRVLIGAPRPKVRGYVKSTPIILGHRQEGRLHFVYDPDFRLVGRVSPRGETQRIDARGDEHHEGSFKLDHAVLLLLGGAADDEVKLTSMPDPRR